MGEEIVENIFAQSNEAKTEYLHAKKAVTRMFGGGGGKFATDWTRKITVAWKSLSIRPARPDGPSLSVYINLAGFSKRLSTVLSPLPQTFQSRALIKIVTV